MATFQDTTPDESWAHRSSGTFYTIYQLIGESSSGTGWYFDGGSRWDNVTIPAGAEVSACSVELTCNTTTLGGGDTAHSDLYFQDQDDFVAPTSVATCNTDHGEKTTATTEWNFTIVDDSTTEMTTPDLTDEIQEVLDRGGWASGQAMGWTIHSDQANTPDDKYQAWDVHSDPDPAILDVTYTEVTNVSPATINAVAGVGAATVAGGSKVSPSSVAGVGAVPAPAVKGGSKVSPGTINSVADVPAPAVAGGSGASPASINAVVAIPAPTVAGSGLTTPATINVVADVPAPTVIERVTVTPAAINAVASVPAPTVAAHVTVTPGSIAVAVALPAPSVTGGSTVAPATIGVIVTVNSPVRVWARVGMFRVVKLLDDGQNSIFFSNDGWTEVTISDDGAGQAILSGDGRNTVTIA